MILFAVLCIGIGVMPEPLYALLPFPVDYVPYTAHHVVFNLQALLFSGLAFFVMLGWLARTLTITLDVDWLYRQAGVVLAAKLDRSIAALREPLVGVASGAARKVASAVRHYHGPDGILAKPLPTGAMAFGTTLLLLAYLVVLYLK